MRVWSKLRGTGPVAGPASYEACARCKQATHLKKPAKLVYWATKVPMVVAAEATASPTRERSPMYQRKPWQGRMTDQNGIEA